MTVRLRLRETDQRERLKMSGVTGFAAFFFLMNRFGRSFCGV